MTRTEQRRGALVKANGIRTARAELKRELKRKAAVGKADARELLQNPPEFVCDVEISDFLRWFPRIGPTKANSIPRRAQVSSSLEVGRLSPSTKLRIIELMPKAAR